MSETAGFTPAPPGPQPPIRGPLQAPPTDWLAILPSTCADKLRAPPAKGGR